MTDNNEMPDLSLKTLYRRLQRANSRILELKKENKELEAAINDIIQYVSLADYHYLKDETRNTLENKDG